MDLMVLEAGANLVDIGPALQTVVDSFTGQLTSAAPIILGAVGLGVGVRLGIKWFKKFASQIG